MSAVIKYRPEIDGLRAVAVLAVILFHLNANWLPGGFAGVDVFFALSGFLITSIIVREQNSAVFSFRSFYVRRMKRILPPLYVMVIVTLVAGVFILTPRDFSYLKESIEYLVLFCSNLYFGKGGDYFGPQSAEMPLLHTWSLAVEEQFYFFWPVLFVLFGRYRGVWKKILFVIVVIASFVYAEYLLQVKNNKPLAYYSLFARYGEMLIGAGIAILSVKKESALNHLGRSASNLASLLGLSLMLSSFLLLDEKSQFPGFSSLPSLVGTLLLIIGMTNYKGAVAAVLSSAAFNHIGKISYSLYLWHWPILAYMRYMFGGRDLPGSWLLVAVVMTYALSVISYYTVEQGVRNLRMSFSRAFVACLIVPSLLVFLVLSCVGNIFSLSKEDLSLVKYGGDEVCHLKFGPQCIRGDSSKAPKILFFGDSHAAHLHYFIEHLGQRNGWSAMLVSASSCGPAFDFSVAYLPVGSRNDCLKLLNYVQRNRDNYDTLVVAARWDFQMGVEASEYSDPEFVTKFEKTLESLKIGGKRVIVVTQVPSLTSNPFRVERALKLHVPVELRYSSYTDPANEMLRKIANRHGVEVMDLNSLVKGLSDGFILNGHTVYMDSNHLNQRGAGGLAEIYFSGENLLK
ncbi:acyltransferase family protein [Bdellovibrio bacteriovorus]|uniref:acyltransferase family protein n=1 Tax=Bdellovibrio bacteriovorus TaxID=959 RepID=UPI003D075F5E